MEVLPYDSLQEITFIHPIWCRLPDVFGWNEMLSNGTQSEITVNPRESTLLVFSMIINESNKNNMFLKKILAESHRNHSEMLWNLLDHFKNIVFSAQFVLLNKYIYMFHAKWYWFDVEFDPNTIFVLFGFLMLLWSESLHLTICIWSICSFLFQQQLYDSVPLQKLTVTLWWMRLSSNEVFLWGPWTTLGVNLFSCVIAAPFWPSHYVVTMEVTFNHRILHSSSPSWMTMLN